jgi:predicted lipoprotein with Yx(FWY)xxD motif
MTQVVWKVWLPGVVLRTMKRITLAFLIAAAAALPASAAEGAAHAASGAKLKVQTTSLGRILATGRGLTVYMFTHDQVNHDTCVAISGCTGIWPLVTSSGTPTLGPGVKRSLVGAIKLPGGARQLTYAGHPLYTYIADAGPGDTSYVGQSQFGGRWYALSPTGRIVK